MSLGFIIIPNKSIYNTREKEMNEKVVYFYNNVVLANNREKGRRGGAYSLRQVHRLQSKPQTI